MQFRILFFVLAVVLPEGVPQASFAHSNGACAVTKAPAPPFVAPPQWEPNRSRDGEYFFFGTPGLWALVHDHWKLYVDGKKLPYFSVQYKWKEEPEPHMVVLARRLDGPAPLVWADRVIGAGPSSRLGESPDLTKPGFMVTRLEIPTAGCWEITARYTPDHDKHETLSYTVLVEP